MIDTLLEIYDGENPISNVLGAWYLQPRKIVYFYCDAIDHLETRRLLSRMLDRIGLRAGVLFEKLDRLDVQDMADWVDANRASLGDYALELTGGDDVLLFMAGCCYERFHCPLYARRADGCYLSLPTGQQLPGAQAAFTVESRLLLSGGRQLKQGRLAFEKLDARFLAMAARIFELHRQNGRLWTQQTRCLQQCLSDLPDDVLTVTLDGPTCRENGVSAKKGHVFRQLKAAGALSDVNIAEGNITLTFSDGLVRDCLCDYGIWLELYVYSALKECGEFDDVRMSCVVQWNEENVVNELDVVATAGLGLLIVSCKTCAPDMEALAELNVLSDRFGSEYTASLLVSMPKGQVRMDGIRARCEEMDIQLLDIRQYSREMLLTFFKRLGRRMRTAKAR